MRKTMFWCSLISAALLGSACKKDSTRKADDQARKAVEQQREDLRKEQKDVAKEEKDVMEAQRELQQAQGNLAQARANHIAATRERLARIDAKINELEARGDAKSKDEAITLRTRRNALAANLDTATSRTDAEWNDYRKNLDQTFDKLEHDVNDALD